MNTPKKMIFSEVTKCKECPNARRMTHLSMSGMTHETGEWECKHPAYDIVAKHEKHGDYALHFPIDPFCPLPDQIPLLPNPHVITALIKHYLEGMQISWENSNIQLDDAAVQSLGELMAIHIEKVKEMTGELIMAETRRRVQPTWNALTGLVKLDSLHQALKAEIAKAETPGERDLYSSYDDGRLDAFKEIVAKLDEALKIG